MEPSLTFTKCLGHLNLAKIIKDYQVKVEIVDSKKN